MNKKLSVIICTYNREKYLSYALESLVLQTQKQEDFEVLIIDNNSSDKTKEVFKKFKDKLPLKYFLEKKQGLSHARNRGIQESNSEFVAFLDDDAKASKDWINQALKIIKKRIPDIFGGPIYPYYDSEKPLWFKDSYEIRFHDKKNKDLNKNEYISGSNIFFKKDIFKEIGLFDPAYGMKGDKVGLGEEVELQMIADKKGIKRFYEPSLFVYHLTPEYKMNIWYFIKRILITKVTFGRFNKYTGVKRLKIFFVAIIRTFFGLILLLGIAFRDKKSYPFWQNYFVEKVLYRISSFAIIRGLF